jgi:hypothetical protein
MIGQVIGGHALGDAGLRSLASEWGGAHPLRPKLRLRSEGAVSRPTRMPAGSMMKQEQKP